MGKEKMPHYRGELDAAQIAAGMDAARRNAARLAGDAKLLLQSGSFPSAASLAALSIEESGKVSILRGLAMAPDDKVRRKAWRDYRSHRSKNTMWILPQLAAEGARRLDELRTATNPKAEHTALLDQVKQLGFYTDCLGDAHWSEPVEVVGEELAKSLAEIAGLLASSRTVTAKEVELWIGHMRPAYGKPLTEMKAALKSWHVAMRESGLAVEDTPSFDQFVGS